MQRPLIGISGSVDAAESQQHIARWYMRACLAAGGLPVLMSLDMRGTALDACLARLDGVLMAGGNDIAPSYFGEEALPGLGEVNPSRDIFEQALIERAVALGMPVMGICRGIQAMNVFMGGTLYQDLPSQRASGVAHHPATPPETPCHAVDIERGTRLAALLGLSRAEVNSTHHQAVRDIAPGLRVVARAPDGVVEAIEGDATPFFLGVQWHPERLADAPSAALFEGFVEACARAASAKCRA